VLNFDIGGGTTNLAWGINGQVLRTGCFFVGARHVQVIPGTYCIVMLSRYARRLLEHLGIQRGPGDRLTEGEVQAILDFYLALLEAAATGSTDEFREPVAELHVQVPFRRPASGADAAVTFSGGVGELIYRHVHHRPWPATTFFGDLGIDLARRIIDSAVFAEHVRTHQPASAGRATVYGLLRHSTEVSGSTLFLPRPELLPMTDMPILGSLNAAATDDRIRDVVELVRHSGRGGCVQIALGTHTASAVRGLGERVAEVLRATGFPPDRPLVLLVQENLGKVLGQYVTQWGALPLNLVVIDEVAVRNAQYVQIGTARGQVVPVSFYGLNERGDEPCKS
jgi:ethanolamine utilization protein EutA